MAVQGELFDIEPYRRAHLSEYALAERARIPLLEILGVQLDNYDGARNFTEVSTVSNPKIYCVDDSGRKGEFQTKFTDGNEYYDNYMQWQTEKITYTRYTGFLVGLFSSEENPGFFLHLNSNVTDIASDVCIDVDSITGIYRYDRNPTEVMAAYQNAVVDDNTYWYQRAMRLPTEVTLTHEELEPWVKQRWPTPTQVYSIMS